MNASPKKVNKASFIVLLYAMSQLKTMVGWDVCVIILPYIEITQNYKQNVTKVT